MAIKTYSIPESDREAIALDAAVRAYCKRHHLNMSGVIVEMIKMWAKEKGLDNG